MECRLGCGACCIAVSISSPIPGMPDGKPAGVRCIQLSDDNLCKIFKMQDRPKVCEMLKAEKDMCGDTNEYAMEYLSNLERMTNPD